MLAMDVDEALVFFAAHPLELLQDVCLGYLTLGQPSPTLSGGEAQRIKLGHRADQGSDERTRRRRPARAAQIDRCRQRVTHAARAPAKFLGTRRWKWSGQ